MPKAEDIAATGVREGRMENLGKGGVSWPRYSVQTIQTTPQEAGAGQNPVITGESELNGCLGRRRPAGPKMIS